MLFRKLLPPTIIYKSKNSNVCVALRRSLRQFAKHQFGYIQDVQNVTTSFLNFIAPKIQFTMQNELGRTFGYQI